MFTHATDWDWRQLGDADPYWAVLTDERFHVNQLDEQRIDEFYASGVRYVELLLNIIRRQVDSDFAPSAALDFGCGVGRITLPLAQMCRHVVGVDISEAMLAKAQNRAESTGMSNVKFVSSDDQLSAVSGRFDFVHSYIVLQHIPPTRGYQIINHLLQLLADGGLGALHVTFGRGATGRRAFAQSILCAATSVFDRFRPLFHRWLKPKMQMNRYDLSKVVGDIQRAGVRRIHVELTDHAGCTGAMLLFKKEPHLAYAI